LRYSEFNSWVADDPEAALEQFTAIATKLKVRG
jgi:hypothetical protein